VGSSSNLIMTLQNDYILGLWGADGYHRTSSIGLTSIYPELVERFYLFFKTKFSLSRVRLRIYTNDGEKTELSSSMNWYRGKVVFCKGTKLRTLAYQIYVNSRPLLREFREAITNRLMISSQSIPEYFSGRFDGDGSVAKDLRTDFRIVYANFREAKIDKAMLKKIGINNSQVYRYRAARTYVLYVSRYESEALCKLLKPYSAKLSGLLVTP